MSKTRKRKNPRKSAVKHRALGALLRKGVPFHEALAMAKRK